MRALSLILGVFCLAGCTGPDIVPVQGTVPAAVYPGDTGAVVRVPADPISASAANASPAKLDSPQDRYDDTVRRGQLKEAARTGLGLMTGSQSCATPGGVVAAPTPLSKPCGIEPLDDFSLGAQRR
jgi:hypothetical protein